MNKNKAYQILESFSKYDLNRFRKYLLSPYFNENEILVKLFDIFNKNVRAEKPELPRELVWKKLFKSKKFEDLKYRRLCSDLNKLAEDFLGYKQYQERPLAHYNNILQSLNKDSTKLKKHFLSVERQALNLLDKKNAIRNAQYHYDKYISEYEKHMYLERNAIRKNYSVNLEEADFHLDCYYLSSKLKNYCDALNYKNILNIDINIEFIETLLELIKNSRYDTVPVISIYRQIALTLTDKENETHFRSLIKLLGDNGEQFPPKELRTMYIFAQNYCIKKINTGRLEYFRELFNLYKTLLSNGVIFDSKGKFTLSNYKNIITVGLANKEFDWVEQFIYDNNKRLPDNIQENALKYNLAHLYFNKGQYENVIELLREMEYKDVFDGLSSRWLLLKTYMELDEFDALEALIDSFRIFLRRNKQVSQINKQKYLNAVRFVSKITRLEYNKKGYADIHQQLNQAKAIVDKKWLLQKLEAMK